LSYAPAWDWNRKKSLELRQQEPDKNSKNPGSRRQGGGGGEPR